MADKELTALTPVPFHRVKFDESGFWAAKLKANREVTIPAVYARCEETGRIDAWRLQWKPGKPNKPHIFWDSDVAKWLESACYSLQTHPDPRLEARVEKLVSLIVHAQQPDGYLNTHFTAVAPEKRWTNLRDWHELYCAGHLIEAALAHHAATGKTGFLHAVCRYADYIASVFGRGAGQKRGYPGHEEIELALVKLHAATGEEKYLALAKYFIDERGQSPHYFDIEAVARGEKPEAYWAKTHEYTQSHLPVRQQTAPVGHAVRGAYLYAAMADLAHAGNDAALLAACKRLWAHTVTRRMYITGGLGSSRFNEGYTRDYDLPNADAYAETCAAIALVFFSHRLLQIEPGGAYADVIERALYNNILSGVSLAGDRFFYENPLESRGDHLRWRWHRCSCCPPNLTRLLASIGQYFYSSSEAAVYVHQYAAGEVSLSAARQEITLRVRTAYPWDGRIRIEVLPEQAAAFTIAARIPGWCASAAARVNGRPVAGNEHVQIGYLAIERQWNRGDTLELDLPMPVACVRAHPAVTAAAGCIALQRGPLVYCLEAANNGDFLHNLEILPRAEMQAQFEPDLLGGVTTVTGTARRRLPADWGTRLYAAQNSRHEKRTFTAIPYFAWANRRPGEMRIWCRAQD